MASQKAVKWWVRFGLVAMSLLVSLAALEILLRLIVDPERSSERLLLQGESLTRELIARHPELVVVHRPNVDVHFRFPERPSGFVRFRTNNYGLRRDADVAVERETTSRRILVLGDSHIDGVVDNDENLCHLLEEALAGRTGQPWEVLNAGVGSYSPYQSFLWYRLLGRPLRPDLILWTIYLGNDWAEMVTADRPGPGREPDRNLWPPQRAPSVFSRLHGWLIGRSLLYGTASVAAARLLAASDEGPVADAYAQCLGCTAQSLGQAHWFKNRGVEERRRAQDAIEQTLKLFVKAATGDGASLLLVILPSAAQIHPAFDSRLEAVETALQVKPGGIEQEFRDVLLQTAAQEGIPVIDLLEPFSRHFFIRSEPLYYRTDWHLNSTGHQVAAAVILRHLVSHNSLQLPPMSGAVTTSQQTIQLLDQEKPPDQDQE